MFPAKSTPQQITDIQNSLRRLGFGKGENKLSYTKEGVEITKIVLTPFSADAKRSFSEGRTQKHLEETLVGITRIMKLGTDKLELDYTKEKRKASAKRFVPRFKRRSTRKTAKRKKSG